MSLAFLRHGGMDPCPLVHFSEDSEWWRTACRIFYFSELIAEYTEFELVFCRWGVVRLSIPCMSGHVVTP